MDELDLSAFRRRIESELRNGILPFWMERTIDTAHGGFHGRISNELVVDPKAAKGLILNTRILWTFARAYRLYHEASLLRMADRAYRYLLDHFFDRSYGGVYWTLDHLGRPLEQKKRTYGQAFTIFALSEFYLASGDRGALNTAAALFELIELVCRDQQAGGYLETFERDWTPAVDQRLSEVDQDNFKSMNTHLHVLEAYAGLARIKAEAGVKRALREVIEIFDRHILDSRKAHFRMFFDRDWSVQSELISFGHDIEGSWLLCEAAEVLGDRELLTRVQQTAVTMAEASYDEGLDHDGALLYEAGPNGLVDGDKHWWPQTEAVVGLINAYQLTGQERFLRAATRCWEFIDLRLIDRTHGEWFWKVSRDGAPDRAKPKVDQWKCPYHNGRMCFEVLSRLEAI
ncbi:MAG TPA: AGE family epimerase/isomerase [Blastocatellia bacterium]|nr:AGE family epimerase/isomerase [Blastocatellia bacterium]